jgi:deoxyribodipyrimidine photo-lyase
MKINKLSIFLFTRDLRLHDNTTLIKCLKDSNFVLPIFILNSEQLSNTNEYKSNNCIQFMCESLEDLNNQLLNKNSRLFLFYGKIKNILKKILKEKPTIDAIYMNKDYTPFALKRENDIKNICNTLNLNFIVQEDYLLTGYDLVKNLSGKNYVKFTPFFKSTKNFVVNKEKNNNYDNYVTKKIQIIGEFKENLNKFYIENKNIWSHGGRKNGLIKLKKIKLLKEYNEARDYPIEETSNLSPYLKFNVLSIREVYWFVKKNLPTNTKLIEQLYWRDFYSIIMYHNNVINRNMNGHIIKWKKNEKLLQLWKDGKTGFPLVDAGMRQLNTTGYMQNRVRMLVASFLIKVLFIDWREGEKYFATKLIDYDPSNNNGGWQWAAGTGTDSQPYFRYLNPWSQIQKFDKNTDYVKKYVEELRLVPTKDILHWNETYVKYKDIQYEKPLFDNITERIKEAIKMYKQ